MYTLITGGSSGLGYEIAKLLVQSGENVIITGRNQEKLHHAQRSLEELNCASVKARCIDLEDEHSVKLMFAGLYEEKIVLNAVYNVAGKGYYGPLSDISKEDLMDVLNANMISLILVSIQAVKYFDLQPAKRHKLVSVLSTAALKGKGYETIYNAAKFGAKGFLLSLEDEVKDRNIDVVRVYPGGMQTPFWDEIENDYPINTFMKAKEVAATIVQAVNVENMLVSDLTINRPKGSSK